MSHGRKREGMISLLENSERRILRAKFRRVHQIASLTVKPEFLSTTGTHGSCFGGGVVGALGPGGLLSSENGAARVIPGTLSRIR